MSLYGNGSASFNTRPIWMDSATLPKQPKQTGQVTVDVCIVGAGISGLTAADLLKKAGKTVAVIDLGRIGCGETGHTTAHLTELFDVNYNVLISHFGEEGAGLAAQSMRRAIERIAENSVRYGIDCEFKRVPAYRFTESRGQIDEIEDDSEAAARLGIPNELLYETPLPFKVQRAMRLDHQAQFHPLKYLSGLAQRIPGDGSYIFEETRMLDVHEGEPCKVTTDRGTIIADKVFVAANVPSTNKFFMHTKIAAYRTYAIAIKARAKLEDEGLFYDTNDPYHYVRSHELNGETYLIVGGEDHKTGQDVHTATHFQRLEDWADERFGVIEVTHRWSGQVIEPVDSLPYIGLNPLSKHVYIATGFSGTGMTMGTVSGMLVSDLILGNTNPWAELFDASRVKPLASIRNYISENIDYPSHLIGDRLQPAQAKGTDRLREDQGAIVRMGGKKVAAYRDPEGELHVLSPVCPHLGCHVNWNEAEKSWDCPCHGARFSPTGKLLNGPAVTDLSAEQVDLEAPMVPERYEQPSTGLNPFGAPLLSMFSCPCKAT